MTLLQARGLVKSYGQTAALRGVTLEVAAGEIVASTGPSGCGKWTLLHCLAGILRPDAGEVLYREQRMHTLSEGRGHGCGAVTSGCCSSSGSSSPSSEPRVLFADEPTGGAGHAQRGAGARHLVRLAREQQTTVLLVTHEPQVAAYANREVLLRDGALDHVALAAASALSRGTGR